MPRSPGKPWGMRRKTGALDPFHAPAAPPGGSRGRGGP